MQNNLRDRTLKKHDDISSKSACVFRIPRVSRVATEIWNVLHVMLSLSCPLELSSFPDLPYWFSYVSRLHNSIQLSATKTAKVNMLRQVAALFHCLLVRKWNKFMVDTESMSRNAFLKLLGGARNFFWLFMGDFLGSKKIFLISNSVVELKEISL